MQRILAILVALVSLSLAAVDADAARRMGGGKSIGKQREAISPQQAAPRTPPQQQQQATQNTPAQQQAAPARAPAAQPSGMSRWLGPLAGLAIGAGLASLFFNNGLGGALMGILLVAALVMGAVLLFRMLRGRSSEPRLGYAGATPAGRTEPTSDVLHRTSAASSLPLGAAPHSVAATTAGATSGRWPADFDEAEFVRHAKLNFVKLQEAHDRRDLTSLRDFLTPEMLKAVEEDIRASGEAVRTSEVATLDAEVLDVATEDGLYVVSVRFSGLLREEPGSEPEPFTEVWHLVKPLHGRSGWQLAGIQQA